VGQSNSKLQDQALSSKLRANNSGARLDKGLGAERVEVDVQLRAWNLELGLKLNALVCQACKKRGSVRLL